MVIWGEEGGKGEGGKERKSKNENGGRGVRGAERESEREVAREREKGRGRTVGQEGGVRERNRGRRS